MTKFISLLRKEDQRREREQPESNGPSSNYASIVWRNSRTMSGVRYAVRRPSLGQRIELVRRTRELALKSEFLQAGETPEQLQAALMDLQVQQLYLEWGFFAATGLTIDGAMPTVAMLLEKGPEALTNEIISTIQQELSLDEEERKNS